jgi:N utilization substance protein B
MARRRALQALYQWQQAGQDIDEIVTQFLTEQEMDRVDVPYFRELIRNIPRQLDKLDAAMEPFLDRRVEELDAVERAVLLIGVYEFRNCIDIPYRVVINEAVQLAKVFGAEQSHRYINGVLDKVAGQLRAAEVDAAKGKGSKRS